MIDKALKICRAMIGEKASVIDQEIFDAIEQCMMMSQFSSINREELKDELMRLYNVRQEAYKILVDSERNIP